MRRHEKVLPKESFGEVIQQEAEFGTVIPNQWSLKLKRMESLLLPQEKMPDRNYLKKWTMDVERQLIIKKDGSAGIIFDVQSSLIYSIFILNESMHPMSVCLELSPDNVHFAKQAVYQKVDGGEMEVIEMPGYSKFVRIKLKGKSGESATVFLQGLRIN